MKSYPVEIQLDGLRDLSEEGKIFAHYLLGHQDSAPGVYERYAAACATLFHETPTQEEQALNLFVRRNPWALPLLDAAVGLIRPHTLLRKILFLLLAILETTPGHTEVFTPKPCARGFLVLRVIFLGITCLLKAAAGIILYPFARRVR